MNLFENNGAEFSADKKYRYVLWRIWDDSKPTVVFIGLNPSTANENKDDNTIRRVKRFANSLGFGGVYMLNLFAWVTPYPDELKRCDDPVGDNDKWIMEISGKCEQVIFAWGSFMEASDRAKHVLKMFTHGYALKLNRDGSPRHPLYVPGKTKLVPYPMWAYESRCIQKI